MYPVYKSSTHTHTCACLSNSLWKSWSVVSLFQFVFYSMFSAKNQILSLSHIYVFMMWKKDFK